MAPTYTVTRIDFSANRVPVSTVNLAFVVSKVTPAGKLEVSTSTASYTPRGQWTGQVVVAATTVDGNCSDFLLLNLLCGIANVTYDAQRKISQVKD